MKIEHKITGVIADVNFDGTSYLGRVIKNKYRAAIFTIGELVSLHSNKVDKVGKFSTAPWKELPN